MFLRERSCEAVGAMRWFCAAAVAVVACVFGSFWLASVPGTLSPRVVATSPTVSTTPTGSFFPRSGAVEVAAQNSSEGSLFARSAGFGGEFGAMRDSLATAKADQAARRAMAAASGGGLFGPGGVLSAYSLNNAGVSGVNYEQRLSRPDLGKTIRDRSKAYVKAEEANGGQGYFSNVHATTEAQRQRHELIMNPPEPSGGGFFGSIFGMIIMAVLGVALAVFTAGAAAALMAGGWGIGAGGAMTAGMAAFSIGGVGAAAAAGAAAAGVAAATGGMAFAIAATATAIGAFTSALITGTIKMAETGGKWFKDIFRAAAIAGLGAALTFGVGHGLADWSQIGTNIPGLNISTGELLVKPVIHGVVQGGMAELSGGEFTDGFISGTAAGIGGGLIHGLNNAFEIPRGLGSFLGNTTLNGALSGGVSALTGGSFVDGFATGAAVYAFNHAMEGVANENNGNHYGQDKPLSENDIKKLQILETYKALFGEDDVFLEAFLKQNGDLIQLKDLWFGREVDVDFEWGTTKHSIELDENLSTIEAAYALRDALTGDVYDRNEWYRAELVEQVGVKYGDDAMLQAYRDNQRTTFKQQTGTVLDVWDGATMVAGVVNEPLDIVITLNELAEGNYAAAIGLLPLIPGSASKAISFVNKYGDEVGSAVAKADGGFDFVPSSATTRTFDLSTANPPIGVKYEGTVYRYEVPERVDTTFTAHQGNINADHRYSAPGEGAVYGGTNPETAFAEVAHYGVEDGRVLVQNDVNLNNVLDLTDSATRESLGVNMNTITSDNYDYTQQIGKWARDQGYDRILAPSARNSKGSNLVILGNE